MSQQSQGRQARLDAGEDLIGWKVGFGAPEAMARLDIGGPLVGYLTDAVLLPPGASVAIGHWTRAVAEPEIAVYLGERLTAGANRERARAAIAAIGPAIELADVSFAPDDVEAILAGNIYNRHVLLGMRDDLRAGCDLNGIVGHIWRNGAYFATVTKPEAATGDLIDIVRRVADDLAGQGEELKEGQLIMTGSIVPPIPIAPGDRLRYELAPIDSLAVSFREGK